MATLVRATGVHEFFDVYYPPGSSGKVITFVPTPGEPPPVGVDFAGDEDDASYIQIADTGNLSIGGGGSWLITLTTPATPVPELAGDIASVTLYVRASYVTDRSVLNQAGCGLEIRLHHETSLGNNLWSLYSTSSTVDPFPLTPDAVIYEHSYTWTLADLQENDDELTWEDLRTAVAAGQVLTEYMFDDMVVESETARTDAIRIHETWFVVNEVPDVPSNIGGELLGTRRRFVRPRA